MGLDLWKKKMSLWNSSNLKYNSDLLQRQLTKSKDLLYRIHWMHYHSLNMILKQFQRTFHRKLVQRSFLNHLWRKLHSLKSKETSFLVWILLINPWWEASLRLNQISSWLSLLQTQITTLEYLIVIIIRKSPQIHLSKRWMQT